MWCPVDEERRHGVDFSYFVVVVVSDAVVRPYSVVVPHIARLFSL